MKPVKLTTQNQDEALVHFLRTYHPSTPSNNDLVEEQIFEAITTEQKSTPKKQNKLWLLPSTIITTILLIISGNAIKAKFLPVVANDLQELETFMVNSWNGSMAEDENESELFFVTLESEF